MITTWKSIILLIRYHQIQYPDYFSFLEFSYNHLIFNSNQYPYLNASLFQSVYFYMDYSIGQSYYFIVFYFRLAIWLFLFVLPLYWHKVQDLNESDSSLSLYIFPLPFKPVFFSKVQPNFSKWFLFNLAYRP